MLLVEVPRALRFFYCYLRYCMSVVSKRSKAARRAHRTRARIQGTAERPRLSVHRSLKHLSAQLIDDVSGTTLFGLNDVALSDVSAKGVERAAAFGALFAKEAQKQVKASRVVFDRGSSAYHGRVKAFADAVREGGFEF